MQPKDSTIDSERAISLALPSIHQFELENGVSGLFIDLAQSPAIAFEACFRAGDYLCPEDKPDLAHFLEHLVLKANEDYPTQRDFDRAVQAHGGFKNAHTDTVNVLYSFDAPDFDWARTLELLLVAISRPLFLPAEFDSEKNVVRQEQREYIDDPERRASELALRQMGYPAARSDERLEHLDSISPDDVRNYHRRTHTLSNLKFVIAGHLPPKRRDSIKQRLVDLDLPSGDGVSRPPSLSLVGGGLAHESRDGLQTVGHCLSFANQGLVLSPEESVATKLLLALLLHGDDSWVYGRGRESGLLYYLFGDCHRISDSANFSFWGQLSPENLAPLVDLVLDAVNRLQVGDLPDDEVEHQKRYAIGAHQRRSLTPRFWIDYFREDYIDHGLVLSPDYRSLVEAVDKDQIVGVGRKLFGSCDWTLGVLGNISEDSRQRIEAKLDRQKAGG